MNKINAYFAKGELADMIGFDIKNGKLISFKNDSNDPCVCYDRGSTTESYQYGHFISTLDRPIIQLSTYQIDGSHDVFESAKDIGFIMDGIDDMLFDLKDRLNTSNEKEETPMISINENKEIADLKELPLNKNNEEPNKIKELEKIINTKTPFVQKEDIITKEPKSVVDLVFQDLPKTNIINDDKLLSPIEVSEYIFKLLEEIESLKDKINKLEKQNT